MQARRSSPVSHLHSYALEHSMGAWISPTLSPHFAYQAFSLGFWGSQFFHRRLSSRRRCHLPNGVYQFCLPRLHFYALSPYKCTGTFHARCRFKTLGSSVAGSKIHRRMRQFCCRCGHHVQYVERSFYAALSTTTVVHRRKKLHRRFYSLVSLLRNRPCFNPLTVCPYKQNPNWRSH